MTKVEKQGIKDDSLTDNFNTRSKLSLDITFNVVSGLPKEYD